MAKVDLTGFSSDAVGMIQQSNKQCQCGSWYHEKGSCNKCGREVVVPESFYSGSRVKWRKVSKGAGWDKKRHKVVWR